MSFDIQLYTKMIGIAFILDFDTKWTRFTVQLGPIVLLLSLPF